MAVGVGKKARGESCGDVSQVSIDTGGLANLARRNCDGTAAALLARGNSPAAMILAAKSAISGCVAFASKAPKADVVDAIIAAAESAADAAQAVAVTVEFTRTYWSSSAAQEKAAATAATAAADAVGRAGEALAAAIDRHHPSEDLNFDSCASKSFTTGQCA